MEKDPLSIHPLPGDGAPAGVRSRRAFLATVGSAACFALAGKGGGGARAEEGAPWGGPLPAAEDGPAVPPGVRLETIAEAEKLARLSF
ncbi:MAG: hypothetical protein ACE5GW_06955, partial [Planctomycetota bacterium]